MEQGKIDGNLCGIDEEFYRLKFITEKKEEAAIAVE